MARQIDLVRAKYDSFFDVVSALLFEADPADLNYGDNTDEYDSEAGTILPRLEFAQNVDEVRKIVFEEFCHWFDLETVGPIEKYNTASERIWTSWAKFKLKQVE